ncbi:MAG: TetR/AcrR family transcriptional regulator [Bacteroidota bacterium]
MGNTRKKILDKARALFNELGYSQVTIRMIATDLEMSSGNLNYHFRKREDILEALYVEMVEVFDNRVAGLEEQKLSLAHMKSEVQTSMERMIAYRFFWTDLYNLLRANKKIRAHFEAVRKERLMGYQYVFNFFINQNLMKPASFEKEYQFLAERMMGYSNTWLYASGLYMHEKEETELVPEASFQLLSMMYPYLKASGKHEFRGLFPEQAG